MRLLSLRSLTIGRARGSASLTIKAVLVSSGSADGLPASLLGHALRVRLASLSLLPTFSFSPSETSPWRAIILSRFANGADAAPRLQGEGLAGRRFLGREHRRDDQAGRKDSSVEG